MFEQIDRKKYFENWSDDHIEREIEYNIMANGRRWWILALIAEKQFRNLEMEGL